MQMAHTVPKLVVTIDVEGRPEARQYDTVETLSEFLRELSIPATLFVTPDVLEGRTDVVQGWVGADHQIGIHIHPERFESGRSKYLMDHTDQEISRMLTLANATFETVVDHAPEAFRAGRWSYAPRLLNILSDCGFRIDSSLRPNCRMPSFRGFGIQEFPLTAVSNIILREVLRDRQIDAIPFALDAVLNKRITIFPFYLLTEIVRRQAPEYLMVAFHDYDLLDETRHAQIRRYLERIRQRTEPVTLGDL